VPLLLSGAGARTFSGDAASMVLDGFLILIFLFAARRFSDRQILKGIDNDDEAGATERRYQERHRNDRPVPEAFFVEFDWGAGVLCRY